MTGLSIEREALVDVGASIATRDRAALERALRLAARCAPPEAVDEVVLQSHLFVGFPIALEAIIVWRDVRPGAGGQDPAADEDPDGWPARGEAVCRTVYGSAYDKLRGNVSALHPDLDRWMVVGGYGRVIGRPGLDLATRELCTAALLVVWNAPRQLHSHLRGALNAGAPAAEVEAAVEIGCRHLDPPAAASARAVWRRVLGGGADGENRRQGQGSPGSAR